MLVSLGLLKLRKMFGKPKAGEFKVPSVPILPIVSILTCIVLMLRLQTVTWIVFGIVMVIGLIIYFWLWLWTQQDEREIDSNGEVRRKIRKTPVNSLLNC